MDDLINNGWNFTEHRDDYLPTPPPCPPSPDCPCPPPRPLPPMPPMPGCPPRPCPPDPCQNRTPNYGLPLWKASDVTSWLMQMNGAMLRIDNIMHDLALRTGINGLPDDLVTTVSKLCQDVAVLNCTVGELSNKQANQDLLMQNMNTQFSAMKTDIASLQLSITNLDTRVMTVDSANQQNRNDITLIKSDLNMLSKTVTNLSSNLTQFQNATNQTLATLQTSVDAIENWMVNPSGNLDRVVFEQLGQSSITIADTSKLTVSSANDDGYCTLERICGDVYTINLRNPLINAELLADVESTNNTIPLISINFENEIETEYFIPNGIYAMGICYVTYNSVVYTVPVYHSCTIKYDNTNKKIIGLNLQLSHFQKLDVMKSGALINIFRMPFSTMLTTDAYRGISNNMNDKIEQLPQTDMAGGV